MQGYRRGIVGTYFAIIIDGIAVVGTVITMYLIIE